MRPAAQVIGSASADVSTLLKNFSKQVRPVRSRTLPMAPRKRTKTNKSLNENEAPNIAPWYDAQRLRLDSSQ